MAKSNNHTYHKVWKARVARLRVMAVILIEDNGWAVYRGSLDPGYERSSTRLLPCSFFYCNLQSTQYRQSN